MELVKHKIALICLLAFQFQAMGQSNQANVSPKVTTFKIGAGLAVGFLTENTQTTQAQLTVAFQPANQAIALRADGFYFLKAYGDRPRFSINNQLYLGAFYTFNLKRIKPYVGFQPGLAYSQASEIGALDQKTQTLVYEKTVNPVAAITGGTALNFDNGFFMFLEVRQVVGKHTSNSIPLFLDEFRSSFGIGFHI